LGGGKFANGAWTASFQHLLNNEAHREPRGEWTKEQAIAELEKDGYEMSWLDKLMFKHESIGNGMEHAANGLGGLGDGVSMGAASKLSAAIYGDEFVWADTDSAMYKTGYWTGVAGTTLASGGSVATTNTLASGARAVQVTSYSSKNVIGIINSGKWVVTGKPGIYTYFKSGLWGGKAGNFAGPRFVGPGNPAMGRARLTMLSNKFFGSDGNWKAYVFGQFKVR
jgi:hypothetical protein